MCGRISSNEPQLESWRHFSAPLQRVRPFSFGAVFRFLRRSCFVRNCPISDKRLQTLLAVAAGLTAESDTTVYSSAQFLEKLKGDLAIETIELLLQNKNDETENRLGHAQILQLLKLCLRTYFTFDGTIYEQLKGTPMGSPISGFIANAILKRLESLVFQHHRPKFRGPVCG
ncbi:hypothetical protein SprV_0401625200 [Sparganum proliferum]